VFRHTVYSCAYIVCKSVLNRRTALWCRLETFSYITIFDTIASTRSLILNTYTTTHEQTPLFHIYAPCLQYYLYNMTRQETELCSKLYFYIYIYAYDYFIIYVLYILRLNNFFIDILHTRILENIILVFSHVFNIDPDPK